MRLLPDKRWKVKTQVKRPMRKEMIIQERNHAKTQCINMHKRAKTPINIEVLADDKTHVPHETKT